MCCHTWIFLRYWPYQHFFSLIHEEYRSLWSERKRISGRFLNLTKKVQQKVIHFLWHQQTNRLNLFPATCIFMTWDLHRSIRALFLGHFHECQVRRTHIENRLDVLQWFLTAHLGQFIFFFFFQNCAVVSIYYFSIQNPWLTQSYSFSFFL